MIKNFNGIPVFIPNTISKDNKEEQFYVSYNPSKRDYGIDTTALVITIGDNERRVFYTLKGNHTEGYDACGNLKESVGYFVAHQEQAHEICDPFEHEHLLDKR